MASERQVEFVLDLAVQAGAVSIRDVHRCYDTVAAWDNRTITVVIEVLKPRVWRSRRPASRKQVQYGEHLLEMLAQATETEDYDIDFAVLDCQAATDEISKLELILDGLKTLEVDATMPPRIPAPEANEAEVLRFFASAGSRVGS